MYLHRKRVPDNVDNGKFSVDGGYFDYIETAVDVVKIVLDEIVLGGCDEFPLLGWGDRLGGRAVVGGSLTPDLDEYECVAVLSDQVDLARFAPVVGRDDAVAALPEFGRRGNLGALTYSRPGRRQFEILSATGAKDFRWHGQGPCRSRASRWFFVQ